MPKDFSHNELINFVDDRLGHDFRYSIDSSLIKNELNWMPQNTFLHDLEKTVEWFIKNQNWLDI